MEQNKTKFWTTLNDISISLDYASKRTKKNLFANRLVWVLQSGSIFHLLIRKTWFAILHRSKHLSTFLKTGWFLWTNSYSHKKIFRNHWDSLIQESLVTSKNRSKTRILQVLTMDMDHILNKHWKWGHSCQTKTYPKKAAILMSW